MKGSEEISHFFLKKLNIVYGFIVYSLSVCSAVGAGPENGLGEEMRKIVPKAYMIGDCCEVRTVLDATNEGAEVGREI
jgi:hypothetical protein